MTANDFDQWGQIWTVKDVTADTKRDNEQPIIMLM